MEKNNKIDEKILLKIPEEAKQIIHMLVAYGYDAFLVGGCVRDILLGKEPHDYDICTSAKPNETIGILENNEYNVLTVGIQFGTVVCIGNDGEEYEITTFRRDVETSGKHRPDVVAFSESLEDDLARRDFSINAMALNIYSREIIDLFGGLQSIQDKQIKAVGDASLRMQEDPLRILRALRFAIALEYNIEDNTFKALIKNKDLLDNVSKERITEEFRKLFKANKPVRPIFLKAHEVITKIIPELKECVGFDQKNRYHTHDVYEHTLYVIDYCNTDDFVIKMSALYHDIGKPKAFVVDSNGFGHFYGHPEISHDIAEESLLQNFRLTYNELNEVLNLVMFHDLNVAETTKSVKRAMNNIGSSIEKWFILKQADRDDHVYPDDRYKMDIPKLKEIYNSILEGNQCFDRSNLAVNGNDIMKHLNIKTGKKIGKIIDALLNDVIEEVLENKQEDLLRASEEYNRIIGG